MDNYTNVEFDANLIRRMDKSGPRYTSYPTADRFSEAFSEASYRDWARKRKVGGFKQPLSLYFHIPFCEALCYYCACNKIITKDKGKARHYLRYLLKEIELQSQAFDTRDKVEQLHWGGGTPTFLTHAQMRELMQATREHFNLTEESTREYSIEIDPRRANQETIAVLRDIGFNRLSLGVQDFDPIVQQAVHRIQTEQETLDVVTAARQLGFTSVAMDLIYGLPTQTVMGFNQTLKKVIDAEPDRIALYSYAHLPATFKPQRRINSADLPGAETKLDILNLAIRKLSEAGYIYIGMDHFSKPSDELAVAFKRGTLHRNFQGYSTHAECDLIGIGVSAIGQIGPIYSQNYRRLEDYYDRLDMRLLPVMRGLRLSRDDLLRRAIINGLMCRFEISIEAIQTAYLIDFKLYFEEEIKELKALQDLGLVVLDDEWISVTPKGRLLVRNICMVFDKYLRTEQQNQRYSKVI